MFSCCYFIVSWKQLEDAAESKYKFIYTNLHTYIYIQHTHIWLLLIFNSLTLLCIWKTFCYQLNHKGIHLNSSYYVNHVCVRNTYRTIFSFKCKRTEFRVVWFSYVENQVWLIETMYMESIVYNWYNTRYKSIYITLTFFMVFAKFFKIIVFFFNMEGLWGFSEKFND